MALILLKFKCDVVPLYCRWSRVAEFGAVDDAKTIELVAEALLRQRKVIVAKGRGRASVAVLRWVFHNGLRR